MVYMYIALQFAILDPKPNHHNVFMYSLIDFEVSNRYMNHLGTIGKIKTISI